MSDAAKQMWEQRYGADSYIYGTEPNEFLRSHVSEFTRGRVMCLAEGEGRNAVFLAESGFEVHSVDLTEAGVAKTLRLAAERGVSVDAQVGDLAEFDLGEDQWDLVVSIFAHLPSAVRQDLHRRVVRSLRPGGVLVLEAYTPDQLGRGTGGPAVADMMMTLSALREELAPLHFVHGEELERSIIEGAGHSGMGAVVQVVARRVT